MRFCRTCPIASDGITRSLYFYEGEQTHNRRTRDSSIELAANQPTIVKNGAKKGHLFLLQGRPIQEPVVQHGPFVMNSQEEIREAFQDYQRTQFGGWPWNSPAPVHERSQGRFAKHIDGESGNHVIYRLPKLSKEGASDFTGATLTSLFASTQ